MVYANLLGMPLMPMSFLLLGWGLQKGLPLALALVACFVASFVNSLYMPALFTVRVWSVLCCLGFEQARLSKMGVLLCVIACDGAVLQCLLK
jgi:hypothetical protein